MGGMVELEGGGLWRFSDIVLRIILGKCPGNQSQLYDNCGQCEKHSEPRSANPDPIHEPDSSPVMIFRPIWIQGAAQRFC